MTKTGYESHLEILPIHGCRITTKSIIHRHEIPVADGQVALVSVFFGQNDQR